MSQTLHFAFVAGDRFTVADITAMVALDIMRVIKQAPPEDCEALIAWRETVKARPSAAA